MKFRQQFNINESINIKKVTASMAKQGMEITPTGYGPKNMYFKYEYTLTNSKDVKVINEVQKALEKAGLKKFTRNLGDPLTSGSGDFSLRTIPEDRLIIIEFKR